MILEEKYTLLNGVGKGARECGVKRKELFLTTKLGAEVKSYDEAVKSINSSLSTERLKKQTVKYRSTKNNYAAFLGFVNACSFVKKPDQSFSFIIENPALNPLINLSLRAIS